jgi:phosphatidyl-myo-inositol alpha-mannosyltransferase
LSAPESIDRPLRIAVTSYYLPSESKIGAGWAAHRLANAFAASGHDVTMFSPSRRPDDASYQHRIVDVPRPLQTFRWGMALRRLDLRDYDVLHAHGDDHLVRRRATAAHVRTLHGSCFDEARHVPRFKEKVRMAALGVTEALSAVRTQSVVGVSRNSIRMYPWLDRVIPNSVDADVFHPGEKADRPTILFVGTWKNRKRGALLASVFADEVLAVVPDAELRMVCTDAPTGLRNVSVLGALTDEQLAHEYRRAWVFCLPSTFEGFGVPYAEALTSGTAVVATRNRGAIEVLDDGASGDLVDDADLGMALLRMLTDDTHRQLREQTGLTRAEAFTHTAVVEQYVDLFRASVRARRG